MIELHRRKILICPSGTNHAKSISSLLYKNYYDSMCVNIQILWSGQGSSIIPKILLYFAFQFKTVPFTSSSSNTTETVQRNTTPILVQMVWLSVWKFDEQNLKKFWKRTSRNWTGTLSSLEGTDWWTRRKIEKSQLTWICEWAVRGFRQYELASFVLCWRIFEG